MVLPSPYFFIFPPSLLPPGPAALVLVRVLITPPGGSLCQLLTGPPGPPATVPPEWHLHITGKQKAPTKQAQLRYCYSYSQKKKKKSQYFPINQKITFQMVEWHWRASMMFGLLLSRVVHSYPMVLNTVCVFLASQCIPPP